MTTPNRLELPPLNPNKPNRHNNYKPRLGETPERRLQRFQANLSQLQHHATKQQEMGRAHLVIGVVTVFCVAVLYFGHPVVLWPLIFLGLTDQIMVFGIRRHAKAIAKLAPRITLLAEKVIEDEASGAVSG